MLLKDDHLRAMYVGGRGNATARRYARFWATVFGAGLTSRRWITLEVPGRRTGRVERGFLRQIPGARPHLPVDRDAPSDAFAAFAGRYPAFRVDFEETTS
ncbi:hypothetical protein Acy02nite_50900 [Actinoplanes cyaneus]|uniref:Uncharacterized protein n=1 Tax=Actinoplanes cyaneus TaxID=52696 RepID=A0A919IK29_9ACTN|nr:hypothetical protein [Actinoplanes cyaneus]MCW2141146.1 hypothetical protein [Actinoplanes cyaneus]GID67209.1 hypothetical protein Acy02nite_50900 [Actinoplanes cyaneus]